ncbi:MAG: AAA domain-containing protein, partial [Planctomycetota bacterium]|nr:AAA domain-containing protein [Planctomycetota bacterium]
AKDLAAQLGVNRKLVNSALHGRLRNKVQQDKSYRWYPKDAAGVEKHEGQRPKQLNTPLARLCRYYLDCLNHDDLSGVSEFAASRYGDPNYVEIETLPMFDESGDDPFDSEAGRRLLGRIRRDRNRQTVFLGYPVRLRWHRSTKGWEGYFVEPLLLFPFEGMRSRYNTPTLSDDLPQINFRALRSLSNSGETNLMEEAIQLAEELGLGNAGDDQPDLDELLTRLCEIRSDWDWQEEIDPYSMSSGTPLSGLKQQGIFNRGILITAERSPYTKGLESELGMLQSVGESKYRGTALGAWLNSQTIDSPPADQQPLLEVLPLNSEQRQSVRQSLSNPLTVITGPPGTGKSQVVMSILVNAAWQGKTVLFASKNNKAVDVVETRVNAIGSRPVLLRLGTSQYQSRLVEYLVSLLAATATADDHERYREFEAIHAQLQQRSDALDVEVQELINLRNEVDHLEQQVEHVRREVGDDNFRRLRAISRENLKQAAGRFQAAIDRANKAKQPFLTRLVWPLVRQGRFEQLEKEASAFQKTSQYIGLSVPDELTIDEWIQYGVRLSVRVSQVMAVQQYFGRLTALTETRPLEELSRERKNLTDDLSANSEALWQAWLQLQPSRMGPEQRKLLGDYSALLQMIVSANDQNRQLGRGVFRRYYQLFPQITSILSCWAVTSLSARGRVPFDPNFFDVLVIDEASQCDIASALPLLYRARKVVVIGDPMQLRHISTLSKQQDQQMLDKHGLVDDHPGWAYSVRSLFDLASSLCRSEDIVTLRDHFRSHADIIEFSNAEFYEHMGISLRVATPYDRLRPPRNNEPAVRWVDVKGKTVRPSTGGAVNEMEAQAVVKELERLIGQGYRGSIGVVSPFRAQANRIRDLVFQRDDLIAKLGDADFLSDAVHSFQGDERDVMFFSPTVSHHTPRGALWFLRNYPNLFNVAITRARAALIVVGDKGAALNCNVDYLARFAEYVGQIGNRGQQVGTTAATDLGPKYPAVSHPERVSEWEHLFYRVLYQEGLRPIPQYPVEKYVLDFAVLDGERRLNIEIDGEQYHRNWDGELCRRDQIRNQRLMELGWDVMRFWVYQVRDELDRCIAKARHWIDGGD